MAIVILNTTTGNGYGTGVGITLTIPATTAGSSLIVACGSNNTSSSGQGVQSVQDNDANPSAYIHVAGAKNFTSWAGNVGVINVYYRIAAPTGTTSVTMNTPQGNCVVFGTIYEVSGIDASTFVEAVNNKKATQSGSSDFGTPISTVFTNALFLGAGTFGQNHGWNSAHNGWTLDSSIVGSGAFDPTRFPASHIIASGTQTAGYGRNTGTGPTSISISTVVFQPGPQSFVLNLSDSVGLADTIDDTMDFGKALNDTITLIDSLNIVNFSNNQFKSLNDMVTIIDSFATVFSAVRVLTESVFLSDSISFQQNVQRTLTEEVRLTEWFSIKKTNSTDWGD